MSKSQYFIVPMSLCCELPKCFSVPHHNPQVAQVGWLEWLKLGISLPQVGQALKSPQQVRLWLNTFSCEQLLLRRTILYGVFQNGNLSTLPSRSMKGFSSDIHCKNLVELLQVKPTKAWGLCPPEVFDSQTRLH